MIRDVEYIVEVFVLCILNRSVIGYDHAEMNVAEKRPVFLFSRTGYVTAGLLVVFIININLPSEYRYYTAMIHYLVLVSMLLLPAL